MPVTDEHLQDHATAPHGGGVVAARLWFMAFRRTRPFWGGFWLMVAGAWILHYSYAPLKLAISAGFAGVGGLLTGGGLMLVGLAAWLAPSQRFLLGLMGMLLSLLSLVASNLGGFFLGLALGLAGSSMLLGWGTKPGTKPARNPTSRPNGGTA